MKMVNSYWENRWNMTQLLQDRRIAPSIRQIERRYENLKTVAERDFRYWYERYTDERERTGEQLEYVLSRSERDIWSESLDVIRKRASEGNYLDRIPTDFFDLKITRLEQGLRMIEKDLFELARIDEEQLTDILIEEFDESYKRAIFEVKSMNGEITPDNISADFRMQDDAEISMIIHEPWKGDDFSSRVWHNNTKELPNQLEKTLTEGFQNGESLDKMVERIDKRFDVAKNRAVTLVQTEAKNIKMKAELLAMTDRGVVEYEYLATLEVHTCDRCADMDRETFLISEAVMGENLPPIHPNCRCTIVPSIDISLQSNVRWARNPRTGASYRVPNISYSEWWDKIAKAS